MAPADCSSAAMPTKAPHTALSEAGAEAEAEPEPEEGEGGEEEEEEEDACGAESMASD